MLGTLWKVTDKVKRFWDGPRFRGPLGLGSSCVSYGGEVVEKARSGGCRDTEKKQQQWGWETPKAVGECEGPAKEHPQCVPRGGTVACVSLERSEVNQEEEAFEPFSRTSSQWRAFYCVALHWTLCCLCTTIVSHAYRWFQSGSCWSFKDSLLQQPPPVHQCGPG